MALNIPFSFPSFDVSHTSLKAIATHVAHVNSLILQARKIKSNRWRISNAGHTKFRPVAHFRHARRPSWNWASADVPGGCDVTHAEPETPAWLIAGTTSISVSDFFLTCFIFQISSESGSRFRTAINYISFVWRTNGWSLSNKGWNVSLCCIIYTLPTILKRV